MARPALRPRLPLLLAVAAALAAAPALAGCIGTASAASAKAHRGAADDAARAWDAGAQLAQVVGVEGSLGALAALSGVREAGALAAADQDETVGDGLAEVWLYRYVAPAKDHSYVVVVDKAGGIVSKGAESEGARDAPLGTWDVDSDRALRLALDANEHLRRGVGGKLFGVVAVLQQEGPAAVWMVAGGGVGPSGAGGGEVLLDAVTGKILRSEGGSGDSTREWMG